MCRPQTLPIGAIAKDGIPTGCIGRLAARGAAAGGGGGGPPTTGLHGLAARLADLRGVGPVELFPNSCAGATAAAGTTAIDTAGAGADAVVTGAHDTQGRFVARPADPGVAAPGCAACAGLAFAAAGVKAAPKYATGACVGVIGVAAAPNIGSGAGLKGRATVLCGVIPAPCGEAGRARPGEEAGTCARQGRFAGLSICCCCCC